MAALAAFPGSKIWFTFREVLVPSLLRWTCGPSLILTPSYPGRTGGGLGREWPVF